MGDNPHFKDGGRFSPPFNIKTLTWRKEEQKGPNRRLAEALLASCDAPSQVSQVAPPLAASPTGMPEIDADSISLTDALILLAGAALSLSAIALCCSLLCYLLHRCLERCRKPQGPILPVWDEKRLAQL